MKTKNNTLGCALTLTKKTPQKEPDLQCQFCGGELIRRGKDKNDNQRLSCKVCHKYFSFSYVLAPSLTFEKNVLHTAVDYLRVNVRLFPDNENLCEYFEKENPSESVTTRYMDDGKKGKTSLNVPFPLLNTKENSISFYNELLSRLLSFLDSDNGSEADVWFLGTLFHVSREKDFFSFYREDEKFFSFRVISEQEKKLTKLNVEDTYLHFDFYGTFFSLGRLKIFDTTEFLKAFSFAFQEKKVTRMDYAMDFKDLTVGNVASKYFSEFVPSFIKPNKNGDFSGIAYGEHSTVKNKKGFLRIYDKLLEAREKKRERLYMDYFAFSSVTRFEVEFRSSLLQDFSFQFDWIFDEEKLLGMVKSWTKNQFKSFDFEFEKIEKTKRTRKEGEKATAKYFLPRFKSLNNRIHECGISYVEIVEYFHGIPFSEWVDLAKEEDIYKKQCTEESSQERMAEYFRYMKEKKKTSFSIVEEIL